ncbi:MAG TPA: ABC transporter ATP-binding protein [Thermomicrobiales bacterium]|nr:ABC transporter ATP-binding protein [Thermomicrobiales bacterium]
MVTSVLALNDISKQFGSGEARVDALMHITMRVDPGELVALIGPSGSGKSTLLSIAGALLTATSGQLLLDGEDIASMSPAQRTRIRLERIGFIFQGSNLVSYLTGREQLMFMAKLIKLPSSEANERVGRLLDALGMTKRAGNYPEEMSGGERQRIAIARALMNDPRIILADEPTASLDSARGRQVVEMLADEVHASDRAGILVTHDERLIDLCDRVIRIEDGEITTDAPASSAAADGKHEQESPALLGKILRR